MEIFMKRVIPKLLLYFGLIPWGAALIFTVIDCIFNMMYLEWLWIPDFCMSFFYVGSYYLMELSVFSMFGIFAAYICFGRASRAILLTVAGLAATILFPLSAYLIQHIMLPTVFDWAGMLDYYYEAWISAMVLFSNGALFLISVLLTKLFFRLILKNKDELPTKMFSLKNPQNFAALIFCLAAVLLATLSFFTDGEYVWEDILSLIVEYAVNGVRFVVIAFVSFTVVKWNLKVYKKAEKAE